MSLATTPRTWVSGETVTAALLNTEVRDNMVALGARTSGSVVNETTDAGSDIVVTHGLGVTPVIILTQVVAAVSTAEKTLRVSARTATTFTVLCYYNGLVAGASNPGWSFDWICEA